MRKIITKNHNKEQGFTLIELLVVIIIIGVLAAIALPIFMNQQKAAIDAQTISDMKNAQIGVNTWKIKYPDSSTFIDRPYLSSVIQKSTDTTMVIYGSPDNYCIKAFNINGGEYFANGSPYLIFISETGKMGNSRDLGNASSLSCGEINNGFAIT